MFIKLALKLSFACVASLIFTSIFIVARNSRLHFSNTSSFSVSHNNRVKDGVFSEYAEPAQLIGDGDLRYSHFQPDRSNSPFSEPNVPQAADENDTPDIQVPPRPWAPDNTEVLPLQDFNQDTHNQIFSVSTVDRKYFLVEFGTQEALNPNIIPHPLSNDKWIIVAQKRNSHPFDQIFHAELACNAIYRLDGVLACENEPIALPIAGTSSGERCKGQWTPLTFNIGPRDARVFYGPSYPYLIYGSNSQYTCFGQWIVDFRTLIPNWRDSHSKLLENEIFRNPIELQRHSSYAEIEKNWFIFWDTNDEPYVHYDLFPRRSFAKINIDGSARAVDLAAISEPDDNECLLNYMPKILNRETEFIHQATNSLSVTLCRRSEFGCEPNDSNTFIITIFHKKEHHGLFSIYEPYVMLFRRATPFQIHAVSRKPLWIHGRKVAGGGRHEMIYVTSMSWKSHGQRYHGYSDDVVFLAFGIDDAKTGGIDVLAGDLLKDMDLCMRA